MKRTQEERIDGMHIKCGLRGILSRRLIRSAHCILDSLFRPNQPIFSSKARMTHYDRQGFAATTAQILLEMRAVHANLETPFKLTSGWASLAHMDYRISISFVPARRALMQMAEAVILSEIGFEQIDAIAGGETAGIPYAAWLAERLMLPMQYVRK